MCSIETTDVIDHNILPDELPDGVQYLDKSQRINDSPTSLHRCVDGEVTAELGETFPAP